MSGYDRIDAAEKHRKLAATDVGINAPRECTNTVFIVLFMAIWGVMIIFAGIAIHHGDLTRLIDGADYLGNVCGQGTPSGITDPAVLSSWSSRKTLFFPVSFTHASGFNIADALKVGVCLSACPAFGFQDNLFYGSLATQFSNYVVLFDSSPRYGRCIPDFLLFACPVVPGTNVTDPICLKEKSAARSKFNIGLDIESTALRSFAELKAHWWVVVVCSIIAIVISFSWMFVLRRLVKPVVVITSILVFVGMAILGYIFYYRHQQAVKDADNSSSADWYLAGAIITWFFAFIYVCVGVYLWRDVMVACDIIEEASKIPLQIPTMLAVPPVMVIFVLLVAIFALFIGAEIYTSASLQKSVQTILIGNMTSPTQTGKFVEENFRTFFQIFNVFVFLWTVGFIHAIGFLVVAFCAVFWYWSARGDEKETDNGVCAALGLTFRNHLGSLALGSLIIAVIQMVRLTILCVEKHLRRYSEKSDTIKFVMCCANCCLAYFERFVQFINKNAYVVQALTGESFLPAARHALQLLVRNALSVGAVNIVGEYVMLVGKLLITVLTVMIGYGILTSADREDSSSGSGFVLILVAVGVVAYFIACVFINVFGVCIDAVLLSYCYDLEQNNGKDKPYYFPEDLGKHVERAERRAKETEIRRQVELQ